MTKSRGKQVDGSSGSRPRVAIAHDYITQRGGAERVVLALHRAFPEASVFTTLYAPETTFPEFSELDIIASPLNHVGVLRRDHRKALPLLAPASSRIHIDADVVIASTTGWAHGFEATGKKIAYCHSPARYLYLQDQYLGDSSPLSPASLGVKALTPYLRRWDQRAAGTVDTYVSNSTVVRDRVREIYGRESQLIFPPHSVDVSGPRSPLPELEEFVGLGGHVLLVSRLLPYKNVDKAIRAVGNLPLERLVIVGDGPEREALRASLPDNVRMVSGISDASLRWLYARSRALLAPSHEDFGLTVVEAAAWGKPSIALRSGGYLDTVDEGTTGRFFPRPEATDIAAAIAASRFDVWDIQKIKAHARLFSEESFARRLRHLVDDAVAGPGGSR
ncbi:glycosyl transferase family 1 [Pseudoclavibacter sp. AY1F1]|uniref:glycosyltransferase n=1 Tax=Pseudoclavibacter sp. AY1F1 TaxID=2080583 RepID=UPI000CE8D8D5|nr:glycosyltransferase [Pseudoclavibacter sp. AY1F1]PPF43596.1 glycosyl transferase family 1 [Pseudoclavibacter sp. AY1F1]